MTVATGSDALPPFDETLIARGADGALGLVGWRCGACGRLAFGVKRMCPICGNRDGRLTRLQDEGRLETWTTVSTKSGSYTVAYALLGDGEDDQEVRVFGPIVAEEVDALAIGQPVAVGFGHREIAGADSIHHQFEADTTAGVRR